MKKFAVIAADGKTIVSTGHGEHDDTVKIQVPPPGGSIIEVPLWQTVSHDTHEYNATAKIFVPKLPDLGEIKAAKVAELKSSCREAIMENFFIGANAFNNVADSARTKLHILLGFVDAATTIDEVEAIVWR